MSVTTRASVCVRLSRRLRASRFGTYPSSSIACSTRSRVSALTLPESLITRETVIGARWEGDPDGVRAGATGLFVPEQTPEAFARAVRAAEDAPGILDAAACRRRAEEFATGVFRERIRAGISRWTGWAP